ncbi:MAG TPA: hypothetical protein PLQ65_02540 [Flavihumibacter sp.]|nr:hypothetical protein [Flavihumibacter sp.]
MKQLSVINKYFWKYRWRFSLGILFIVLSNYFRILSPQITGYVIDAVERLLPGYSPKPNTHSYDPAVRQLVGFTSDLPFSQMLLTSGLVLLSTALLSGFFLFLTRQTIIVMSRHIEFDQKNEIYQHYQLLDLRF